MMPFMRIDIVLPEGNAVARIMPEQIESFVACADGTCVVMKSGNIMICKVTADDFESRIASYWQQVNRMMADAQRKAQGNILIN